MLKTNNMRVLLVVSVVLFVLFSSVNMVPARSFLGEIQKRVKRQGNLNAELDFCFGIARSCIEITDCYYYHPDDPESRCLSKTKFYK